MAVKTITITEDAYAHLAALKAPNESFTDVVLRVTGKHSLLGLAGVLSAKEAEEVERAVREMRRKSGARIKRIAKELS